MLSACGQVLSFTNLLFSTNSLKLKMDHSPLTLPRLASSSLKVSSVVKKRRSGLTWVKLWLRLLKIWRVSKRWTQQTFCLESWVKISIQSKDSRVGNTLTCWTFWCRWRQFKVNLLQILIKNKQTIWTNFFLKLWTCWLRSRKVREKKTHGTKISTLC